MVPYKEIEEKIYILIPNPNKLSEGIQERGVHPDS